MRTTRYFAIALTIAALSGCGGGASSPADEVRAVQTKALAAVTSDHPERMCQYTTDHAGCIGAIASAKALGLEVSDAVDVPDDWRARVKRAKVVIKGDRATLSTGDESQATHFVRRGGQWLADN